MFLRFKKIKLFCTTYKQHLALITKKPPAERAYLADRQVSPIAGRGYTGMSTSYLGHFLVIGKNVVA